MKIIGLLGGMSWESSIHYEEIINTEVRRRLGGVHSADLLVRSYDFATIEDLQAAGDWDGAGCLLAADARRLQEAGAEVIVLCTNTMHRVAGAIEEAIDVPFLHLAEATADAVVAAEVGTVALLGTRYTMEQEFYRSRLEQRGLRVVVPPEPDRSVVHDVIYDELVRGRIRPESNVDYVFLIEGVSRAFTHQLVRTRTASFAQESQRTVDVSDAGWTTPEFELVYDRQRFDSSIKLSIGDYASMISGGVPVQDARGALPTAIHTNIFMKANLRTMAQMAETRLCTRTQGEYQDVFRLMKDAVVEVHPWADDFINVYCVNTGICQFPRYEECPLKEHTIYQHYIDAAKKDVKKAFKEIRHEATPVAKNGKTM